MCIRLSNKHHCLTCISVLSVIQLVWGSPIAALGLFIFLTTSLGALLSPFWAGFTVRLSRVHLSASAPAPTGDLDRTNLFSC